MNRLFSQFVQQIPYVLPAYLLCERHQWSVGSEFGKAHGLILNSVKAALGVKRVICQKANSVTGFLNL